MSLICVFEVHRLVDLLLSFSLLVPLCEVFEGVFFITFFIIRVNVSKVLYEAEVNIFILKCTYVRKLLPNLDFLAITDSGSRDLLIVLFVIEHLAIRSLCGSHSNMTQFGRRSQRTFIV